MADLILFRSSDLDEREVARAALEAADEHLQSLCASHAGTFVAVERRGREAQEALADLLAAIKSIEGQVANVHQALEQDEGKENSLAVLSERHRVRRRTLLQHSSLLELLELPSLMDACVRSNLYEEALSIAAFANTLERRHKDSNDVVLRVIHQVRARQTDLARQLLHRLKSTVTMPQCLEIVTALRRLNSIDLERQSESNLEIVHSAMEMRLQVDFLEARDAWVDSKPPTVVVTTSSSTGAPSTLAPVVSPSMHHSTELLLDAIERYRTRMFEVATQFNAIFRAQTNASDTSVALLCMWTARRVHSFLRLLSVELAALQDAAALRDALEASVFLANSMGRLGADFTAQLPPFFEAKMHTLVVKFWTDGADRLNETLIICRDAGVATPLIGHVAALAVDESSNPADRIGGPDHASSSAPAQSMLDGPQPPPRQLMAVPPLARLVNAVLSGLNELRRCLLPGIFPRLRASLKDLIQAVQTSLDDNERAVLKPGLRGEAAALRDAAARFRSMFTTMVVPYLWGSLEAALGNQYQSELYYRAYWESLREPPKKKEDDEESPAGPDGDHDVPEVGTEEHISAAEEAVNTEQDYNAMNPSVSDA